jgi:mannonate dehydratase
MLHSWRWFGPLDKVPLTAVAQAGATGVVSALHHIPYGEVWSAAEISKRQDEIAQNAMLGLHWNVVESLPLHESIKLGEDNLTRVLENYKTSMRNLAKAGITTICYNFMPVIDWTRTQLNHPLPNGGTALRFNAYEFAAFECFMLQRKDAEQDYAPETRAQAKVWFNHASEHEKTRLLGAIMAGLPGAFERYDIPALKQMLLKYKDVREEDLRQNLIRFLKEIIPLAQELGMRLAIHPDDPPRALMGIVRNADDLGKLFTAVPPLENGLTLCSGSLGAGVENNVPEMAQHFAPRIHFAHLRNVSKEPDGSFMEAAHLEGDTDMVALIDVLLAEQTKRKAQGRKDWRIPMRPDHGHELMDDVGKGAFPGYSAIGRLKGLAELRGVMVALAQVKGYTL